MIALLPAPAPDPLVLPVRDSAGPAGGGGGSGNYTWVRCSQHPSPWVLLPGNASRAGSARVSARVVLDSGRVGVERRRQS